MRVTLSRAPRAESLSAVFELTQMENFVRKTKVWASFTPLLPFVPVQAEADEPPAVTKWITKENQS